MSEHPRESYDIIAEAGLIAKRAMSKEQFGNPEYLKRMGDLINRSPLKNAASFIKAATGVGEKVASRFKTQDPDNPVLLFDKKQQIYNETSHHSGSLLQDDYHILTLFTRYESVLPLGTLHESPYILGQRIIRRQDGSLNSHIDGEMYIFEGPNKGKGIANFKIDQYSPEEIELEYPAYAWRVEFEFGEAGRLGFEYMHFGDGDPVGPVQITHFPRSDNEYPSPEDVESIMKELGFI